MKKTCDAFPFLWKPVSNKGSWGEVKAESVCQLFIFPLPLGSHCDTTHLTAEKTYKASLYGSLLEKHLDVFALKLNRSETAWIMRYVLDL